MRPNGPAPRAMEGTPVKHVAPFTPLTYGQSVRRCSWNSFASKCFGQVQRAHPRQAVRELADRGGRPVCSRCGLTLRTVDAPLVGRLSPRYPLPVALSQCDGALHGEQLGHPTLACHLRRAVFLARRRSAARQAHVLGSPRTRPSRSRHQTTPPADGLGTLLAIRDSALRQGRPMLGPDPSRADGPEPFDSARDRDEVDGPEIPDRLLAGLEGLDGSALQMTRREQRRLRLRRFGSRPDVVCVLCGRRLPTDLVRLAHIKRRAEASFDERLTFANTMPACTLGRDEMFERGYILVDEYGHIRANRNLGIVPDLHAAIAPLVGRVVIDYQPSQAQFFQWHRDRHGT